MAQRKLVHSHIKRLLLAGLAIIVIVLVIVLSKEITKTRAVSGPIKPINTKASSSTGINNTPNTQPNNTSPPQKTATISQSSPGGVLLDPYGALVSNHKPGQNGSNLTEQSQCTTTPGATCYIKFTQGDIVKTLPTRTADSTGTVFWEWNVSDAGLTSGKWTITAVANIGSQTKTTTDQLGLEVQ